RSSLSSWKTTSTPSLVARMSNSLPSPPSSNAARNASNVFSWACSYAPRRQMTSMPLRCSPTRACLRLASATVEVGMAGRSVVCAGIAELYTRTVDDPKIDSIPPGPLPIEEEDARGAAPDDGPGRSERSPCHQPEERCHVHHQSAPSPAVGAPQDDALRGREAPL